MCTCGSHPNHAECSRCAAPPDDPTDDWTQPTSQATSPSTLGYDDEQPF
ncbi:hypothetical protein ACWCWD_29525 [Streptomyces sp. NPDC001493]